MITFEKSLPGSGKNLKWLLEMAFQGFYISRISPSNWRSWCTSRLPPSTQISSYSHKLGLIVSLPSFMCFILALCSSFTFPVSDLVSLLTPQYSSGGCRCHRRFYAPMDFIPLDKIRWGILFPPQWIISSRIKSLSGFYPPR